ncbi:hypothetical protein JOQ06_018613 [Pogonophryne albipinna]|uniref:PiggyBac transposable element-derived protein domain-containing protein n=1 Tax=Pogonophryne albipinna TaxID=1090488 RepID=A0AAD6AST7_9TELE|nr:hypothetical protein JOQ06_018613 [Pogonophryne albipinna]
MSIYGLPGSRICIGIQPQGVDLQTILQKRKIHCVGKVRHNRLAGCSFSDDKVMKKKGRGTFEEKATSYDGVQLRAVKWHDNRAVHLFSTFTSANPTISVQRWDKKKKETVQVTCPSVVHAYNKSMGGVDLLDSLIALYRTKIRSRKWYHKIVFHMMDFTAWHLYRRDCKDCGIPKKEVYSLLKFKAEVASCLCNKRKVLKKRVRPSHNEKKRRGSASSVPSTPGRCKYPGCKGIVKVQCSKCVTYLCFTADKNCFMNFHKQ